jgi:hypothetical protein
MKKYIKRTAYLAYYLRETDRKRFVQFLDHACQEQGASRYILILDVLHSAYKYNISLLDYFYFRFYQKSDIERAEWAGTGFMYEYQRVMNPPSARILLEDKISFLHHFESFVRRPFADLNVIRRSPEKGEALLSDPSGKVVLKAVSGQCGQEVEILETAGMNVEGLLRLMKNKGYHLAEGYVAQHRELMALSPSGLNTVRMITQLESNGEVRLLGVRLRITVNSTVDNLAAGNMAAPVDPVTGVVYGSAVYGDITKDDTDRHPVTGVNIRGFKIPFWLESVAMVEEAARKVPNNRSVGWDVAITQEGPELIEGNHDWCKLVWQLPVQKGLKYCIIDYEK